MPLKLVPPKPGRTTNWRVRGTHLGVTLDRSTQTPDRAIARKRLLHWKAEIEAGELTGRREMTFAAAALAYVQAGGEDRFVLPIANHFGARKLVREIDQIAIDGCAAALLSNASPATRNRQVYTPVSAILRHVGAKIDLRRPKGAQGDSRTAWMRPEQAERLLNAALAIDLEFGIFLTILLATGVRLSDALGLDCANVDLSARMAYLPTTKNGKPQAIFLPPPAVSALAAHPRGIDRPGTVFRFAKNGHLYTIMKRTRVKAGADLDFVTFHIFRHTWATWMRKFGGLDEIGLVGTGRWKDRKSVARYAHAEWTEESSKATLLPIKWKA